MSAPETNRFRSPHRLVRASAGSGKTFQLTNVLLRLLLAGENPGELLATTFTRAAAGEIFHRTLARLSDAVIEDQALEELRRHIDPTLTRAQCAAALERVVGDLHRLSIMTIDALFARLASSFSFELGLAPGWRMLDEEEDERLRAMAIDLAMAEAPDEETLEILRELQGEQIRTHAHRAILDVVKQGYTAYIETHGDEAVWSAIGTVGKPLDDRALADAISNLDAFDIPQTKGGKPRRHWQKNLDDVRTYAEARNWESFAGLTLIHRILINAETFDSAEINAQHGAALAPLIDHARHALTADHARRTMAALRLLSRFDKTYTRLKRAVGGLTFDDPPRLHLAAETTGDLAHLYFRLDARLRHVLLDEFQDTSMLQFKLIEPILDEMLSQDEDGRSVFCVGDAKQSLYAWREAEPTLLPALGARWPTLHEDTLAKSWRSSPAVLEAVNAIFGSMATNSALLTNPAAMRAAQEWDARFDAHVAAKEQLSGMARLSVALAPEHADPSGADALRSTLETAVQRVAEAREQAPGASIAVLVRRGAGLRILLGMLKRRGIDASEQRGNPLVDAPPVAAATSLLRLIDHPGHTAALFHVASTPLGEAVGLTDPADMHAASRIAARLRRNMAMRGMADVVSGWFSACAGAMDARGAARFDQLIDLAETFDHAGRGGPTELAEIAETRRINEPGRAPVRVMTIHGAKGLEFDVVVLPLVASKPWNVGAGGVLMMRDEPLMPVMRASRYPNEFMRAMHPKLEELHAHAFQKQINEELCCLYVAMTRARRRLEIVVSTDKPAQQGKPLGPKEWRLLPAHVVRAALAPERPAEPGATLWEFRAGSDWADAELRKTSPPEKDESITLSVCARAARSASRLAGATPSRERTGETVSAASLLTFCESRGATLGDLVHRWFERIEWLDDETPSAEQLLAYAAEAGFDAALAREALPMFVGAIERAPIRAALSRSVWMAREPRAEEVRVRRERPFAVRDGDRLLEGRFDRLVIGRTGERTVRAEVFDFKTDHAATGLSGDALSRYAETHRAQMEAYQRAAARLLSLSEDHVAVTLIFTAAGECFTPPPIKGHRAAGR